jgi:glutaminyl-tRNA synthetase
MAVLNPLKVVITNKPISTADVPYFPFDVTREHHTIPVDDELYIDKSDFKLNPTDDYYGLSPGKVVGLKYAFRIQCDSYEVDPVTGEVCLVRCTAIPQNESLELKAKVAVQWVPASYAVTVEVRDYNSLFVNEEPNDATWEAELNPQSEVVYKNAIIDKSIISHASFGNEAHYQVLILHLLTYLLTHSLAYSLTHSLTRLFTHSLTYSLIDSLTLSLS